MKKKSSPIFSLFVPGVFLGAVIGFIFGALLVARLADDVITNSAVAADVITAQ